MNHLTSGPRHRAFKNYRVPVGIAVGALMTAGLVTAIAPANAATKVVTANLVDQSETRATGHNVFTTPAAGVRVYTEGATSTDKAAGYFDVNRSLNAVAAVEPTMSYTQNSTYTSIPGKQLKVDFNGDGSIDGILVGEPVYGNDWWLPGGGKEFVKNGAPSHTGGSGSDNHGTLAQWKSAFPTAKVIQGGWSLGSGALGDGTIKNFVIAGDTYTFAAAPATTNVSLTTDQVDQTRTLAQGTNKFLTTPGGGVEIETVLAPDPTKAKSYGIFPVGQSLSQAGEPKLDYTYVSGDLNPATVLNIDFDGDGSVDGTLVAEPKYPNGANLYGDNWWLSNSSSAFVKADAPDHGGGFGSDNNGKLSEWRNAFPNAKIVTAGWNLGSEQAGHGVINSITVGTTKYGFVGNTAATAAPVSATTPFGTAKSVVLAGSDAEGDALTYTVGTSPNGTVSLAGNQATFTPAYGFSGTASFGYTVKDATHPAAASTVTIGVGAPPVDTGFVVTVTKGGTATKPTVTLTGKTNAPLAVAGSITVSENGIKLKGSGVLGRNFNIPLGTQTVGTHVYVIAYDGKSATVVVQTP
ncbi:MAG: Ig-like domain repeat protein [Marmoricola sp.]|nr:Ig-like domain repeat protein [Marmoricola sp.]